MRRGLFFAGRAKILDQDQIVPVNQFLFTDIAQYLADLMRGPPHDTARLFCTIVAETTRYLATGLIPATHHFTALELA